MRRRGDLLVSDCGPRIADCEMQSFRKLENSNWLSMAPSKKYSIFFQKMEYSPYLIEGMLLIH